MSDIEIQTADQAREEADLHSSSSIEIVLTDELIEALKSGKVLHVLASEDTPVFIALKSFL